MRYVLDGTSVHNRIVDTADAHQRTVAVCTRREDAQRIVELLNGASTAEDEIRAFCTSIGLDLAEVLAVTEET